MRLVDYLHREEMAYSTVAPSIESLLKLAPEDPESWVLGSNPKVNRIARHVERAADVECTVLVSGETGTGKELWARLLHRLGPRRDKPFIPVNCAALTATLAESQLFGHEKGAFTGAAGRSLGVFRAAEGGIVFLDEVGEMPLELQPKLLRVLQQHEVTPVGASMPAHVNVQVVAATNRDLELEVARRPLPRRLVLSPEHGRVPRAAAAASRGRYPAISSSISRGSLPPATNGRCGGRRAKRCGNSANIAGPATFASWPTSSSRRTCSTASRGCPNGPTRGELAETSLPFMDLAQLRRAAVRQALRATRGHKSRAARLLGVHPNTMTRLLAQLRDEDASNDVAEE